MTNVTDRSLKIDRKINNFKSINVNLPKQSITFAVTEECNLNCSYCYLPGKNSGKKMTFEVARKAVDYFLSHSDFFNSSQLNLDFIGGEPLLAIDLVDRITDYFKMEAYRLNHVWFSNYRISLTTNGVLYHTKKVQQYVEKNRNCLSPAISLDGTKEKHDNARKYYNGKGSYDDVVKNTKLMMEQFPNSTQKATFGKGDLQYYKDSIIHFMELGYPLRNIFANVIYEEFSDDEDALVFEQQLRELADYLIDNDLCSSKDHVSIFSDYIGRPYTQEHIAKHWCNAGNGVLVSTDGSFYPCIRFLEMAFEDRKLARKIGDVENGIDFDRLRPYRVLTLGNCSPDKCLECNIASGCGMCSGHALTESSTHTLFSRPTHICKMHKARVKGNNYFWEKLAQKESFTNRRNSYLTKMNQAKKKILNIMLSAQSPSICSYKTANTAAETKSDVLPQETLKEYIAVAKENGYFINLIYSNDDINVPYKTVVGDDCFQVTRPYKGENSTFTLRDGLVFILDIGQELEPEFSCANVILHLEKKSIPSLAQYAEKLYAHNVLRINVVTDDLISWEEEDLQAYEGQLFLLKELLVEAFRTNKTCSINILSDRLMLDKMNNCNAGIDHLTLGPDGKLYLCPAFYYKKEPLADMEDLEIDGLTIPQEFSRLLKLEKAPICSKCDAYQCQRCHFQNKNHTNELNIPGHKQCIVAHIEREACRLLQQKLTEECLIPHPGLKHIAELNYSDPFAVALVW
jgi:radical SAM peptide maturase (CXXX-repeat target family)/CXXX repeat peptide maturase